MAYLNTQLSKQKMGVIVDNIPICNEQPASIDNEEPHHIENSNVQIARFLKDEKTQEHIEGIDDWETTNMLTQYIEQQSKTIVNKV